MSVVLLLAGFAVILLGAMLFTNAVEWLGHRLSLGEGAVGSLLAAVGTAMPETLIPIVAILGGKKGSEGVAIGAILGAPFLLATIAMALVGTASYAYRDRREQGHELDAHAPTLERDLAFFFGFFAAGLALGWGVPDAFRIPAAVLFLGGYGLYVRATLKQAGDEQSGASIEGLVMSRTSGGFGRRGDSGDELPEEPPTFSVVMQVLAGLALMVGGAHLFVQELLHLAESLGVEALILSLVLAPLATELPEKANSFIWVRDGKDSLALGNITGAMVFQSTIPVAFGLAFTTWELDRYAVVSGVLGLIGGAVAFMALRATGRFDRGPIAIWIGLYAVFLSFVLLA